MGSSRPHLIRAAGGVVWRTGSDGLEIAVVHRPRYDDWALPKGKLDRGESELDAAVREVREELGSAVAVSRRLGHIAYDTAEGPKQVAFWVMRHRDGEFRADDEVDDHRWVPPARAREVVDYDVERDIVDAFLDRPVPDSVVVLVRHARAGKRSEWHADDNDRPLDEVGRRQAERLSGFLQHFAPDRIIAAHPLRCVQTVRPLSRDLGLEIAVDGTVSDAAWGSVPEPSVGVVTALAEPGRVTVVSSQGDVIPGLVQRLTAAADIVATEAAAVTKKAAAWVLGFADEALVSADYYPAAAR